MSDPTDPDRSEIEFEQANWQKANNPFYIWDSHRLHYTDKVISYAPLFKILYRLDFKAWIESLENLPLPRVKKLVLLHSDLIQDQQAILELIKDSSPVFDEHGKWTDQKKQRLFMG